MFGMRGLDYRCATAPMHLIIAKSFDTERGALQGLNRVGRFGDQCVRIRFTGTDLINKRNALLNIGALSQMLGKLAKTHVAMKPVAVKKIQTKAPKSAYVRDPRRAE
jgi:hypothetical protein